MIQLDSFDRAILAILQDDAALSFAELGRRVNLSASAALRRVQRLRETGAIIATRAIADPEKLGCPLVIIVEIALQNEQAPALEGTKQALVADPFVQQCYYVTGEADLFVVLMVPAMAEFKAFMARHFTANPHIKRFKTTVVLDRIKVATAYPV